MANVTGPFTGAHCQRQLSIGQWEIHWALSSAEYYRSRFTLLSQKILTEAEMDPKAPVPCFWTIDDSAIGACTLEKNIHKWVWRQLVIFNSKQFWTVNYLIVAFFLYPLGVLFVSLHVCVRLLIISAHVQYVIWLWTSGWIKSNYCYHLSGWTRFLWLLVYGITLNVSH